MAYMTKAPSSSASQNVSPIPQPSPPARTSPEDDTMALAYQADQSMSGLSEQVDEPGAEVERERLAVVSAADDTTQDITGVDTSATDTALTGTSGDAGSTTIQSRCVVNFLEPRLGSCDSQIFNDDRHYISNFFGRNKACSTSIPDSYYQVLCRKCMQGMKYRLKTGDGATEIQSQVAAIKHVLQNMKTDGRWPWVEVQLTKSEYDRRQNPKKYEEEINKANEEILKAREEARHDGKAIGRRNTKKPLEPVPEWLVKLVQFQEDYPGQINESVHERDPRQYSFDQMMEIMDLIQKNCKVLPSIECLPITPGEADLAALRSARDLRDDHKKALDKWVTEALAEANAELAADPKNKAHQDKVRDYQAVQTAMEENVRDAEAEIKEKLAICAKSAHTLPPKRQQLKKSDCQEDSSKVVSQKWKKGMKGKKATEDTETGPRATSDDTLPDTDVQHSDRAMIPSHDADMVDAPPLPPSPPPGWKGKAKTSFVRPSTPPAQVLPEMSHAATTMSPQQLAPAPTPASANTATATTTRPTIIVSPTSTTRSACRRLERVAHAQAQAQVLASAIHPATATTTTTITATTITATQEETRFEVEVAEHREPVSKKPKLV